ncbi:hypothetical protein [Litchfieldia salsa]|uniref:Uncharacterized protein n=1 Tax=Litchfieldia salsa TaxID=930152 RepID=A0A1H0S326_9BACI|nr:hypothetical protein [Litchfieldia salsa]SDP36074.1 hypothetical protein SAMN05216565_102516 [Litchfieldia salsa]
MKRDLLTEVSNKILEQSMNSLLEKKRVASRKKLFKSELQKLTKELQKNL